MSDYTVVADVGETLLYLLRENTQDLITPASIILSSPGEIVSGDYPRLCLFLYQVVENAHLRNQEMQAIDHTQLAYPPLTLDLYYMLTAYGSSQIVDRTDRMLEAHKVLGRAMRVLYDNAILRGSVLRGSLSGTSEEIRVNLHAVALEEINRLWNSFPDESYRLSVCYAVTPVRISTARTMEVKRVVEKDTGYYQLNKVGS